MSEKIDELLDFLALYDGSHNMNKIAELISIPYDICEKIVRFLAKFGFIQISNSEIKINPEVKDFVMATLGETVTRMPRPIIHQTLQQ